jgi:hypothetical protein
VGVWNPFVLDPQTPGILYAGYQEGGVGKSVNWGEGWMIRPEARLGTRIFIWNITIDSQTPSTLYAAAVSEEARTYLVYFEADAVSP